MAKTLTNKKLVCAAALTLLAVSGMAQSRQERMVRTPNYELAERFSAKRIGQMVFSTSVRPVWFRNGDKILYAWKTSDGTQYYIADPKAGKTEPVFDMDKLAMQITEIMRDPFDAKHLPISNISIDPENDGILKFDIKSTKEKTDTTGKATGEKLTYHFRYEIAGKKLTYDTADKKEKYPDWANVSPDGLTGVYMKNSNLFYMDTLNLRKAAEDPKDSTLVEHRITSDGYKDFCYGINNYSGNTETDTTKRVFPSELVWSPDSRHIAVMRWDMAPLKDFWVINSLTQPRPTLETYKYQMPGEPGPKGHLYVFSTSDWTSRQVKINAFKDQDLIMQPDVRTTDDQFDEFYGSRWLGDDNGFYLTRMSRDLKRMDICYVGVDSDSTRTVISERMNTYVESRQTRLLDGGRKMIHWSERNGWANLYLYNAD